MQDLAVMESLQLVLENVVSIVFDGLNEFGNSSHEVHLILCQIFEGLIILFRSFLFTCI